ncbi:MAG TPA: DUF5615 family PIN-like protein [Stellaceae bacterium]|nr:DUF5615 family PIN-like protein [Stellaceae bacterium]
MKFLVDAQLPSALASLLTDLGHRADHVAALGLLRASDAEIWNFALDNGMAIITKDEDFAGRRSGHGGQPIVIWLRRGNCSRAELLRWFAPLMPTIVASIESGEGLIEVR